MPKNRRADAPSNLVRMEGNQLKCEVDRLAEDLRRLCDEGTWQFERAAEIGLRIEDVERRLRDLATHYIDFRTVVVRA